MSEKPRLSQRQMRILLDQGVIEMPLVPPVARLADAIKARGGRWSVSVSENGFAAAKVTMMGGSFDGAGDTENQAMVEALCQALVATQPSQASFIESDSEDEEDDEDDEEPAARRGLTFMGEFARDPEPIVVPPHLQPAAVASPDQMATELRASGLPITWDGAMYRNTDTGDAYDGADGDWVAREYRSLATAATALQ